MKTIVAVSLFATMLGAQTQMSNRDARSVTVLPSEPKLIEFVVDPSAGEGDVFDVACSDGAAVVSLVTPSGAEITAGNAEGQGIALSVLPAQLFRSGYLGTAFGSAGVHTLIRLAPSALPGKYSVKVDASAAGGPVTVVAVYGSSSNVRVGLSVGDAVTQVGRAVAFTATAWEGDKELANLTATLQVMSDAVGAQPATVEMVWDESMREQVGGGIYLGVWKPREAGNYVAALRVTGVAGTGIPFSRLASATVRVVAAQARFVSFRDAAVDENADGALESLAVLAKVRVTKAGSYRVAAALGAVNGKTVKANAVYALEAGDREVALRFRPAEVAGLEVDGPYAVQDAVLVAVADAEGVPLDQRAKAGSTAAYAMGSWAAARPVKAGATSLAFPNTTVGSSAEMSLTLTNASAMPVLESMVTVSNGVFAVDAPIWIGAQSEQKVAVRFTPKAAGAQTGTLTVAGVKVALSGAGVAPVALNVTWTPGALDFGSVVVGQVKDLPVTLKNPAAGKATIASLAVTGSGYVVVSPTVPFDVAAGGQQVVTVRFAPGAAGSVAGTLSVGGQTVALSGTGVAASVGTLVVEPAALEFGSVTVGQTKELVLTVRNPGTAKVSLATLGSSSVLFTVVSPAVPVEVPAQGSQLVTVRFAPVAAGTVTSSLSVNSLTVRLSGTGVAAGTGTWTLSAATLDFGVLSFGSTKDMTLTLTNGGPTKLTLPLLVVTGAGFSLVSPVAPLDVAPGAKVDLVVRLRLVQPNDASGTLRIYTSDPARSSVDVALRARYQ